MGVGRGFQEWSRVTCSLQRGWTEWQVLVDNVHQVQLKSRVHLPGMGADHAEAKFFLLF